jgi:hypothetical protein
MNYKLFMKLLIAFVFFVLLAAYATRAFGAHRDDHEFKQDTYTLSPLQPESPTVYIKILFDRESDFTYHNLWCIMMQLSSIGRAPAQQAEAEQAGFRPCSFCI